MERGNTKQFLEGTEEKNYGTEGSLNRDGADLLSWENKIILIYSFYSILIRFLKELLGYGLTEKLSAKIVLELHLDS